MTCLNPPPRHRSNSPAMLPDPQGMFHHPVFHPAHLHQGPPPPAPEVRIYDPVTGKLIRRGQHGQQPPPYLQAPGSMSQPDHRNTAPPR